jgi:hypothetical protein
VVAVVTTVRTEVTAVVPVTSGVVGFRLQVAGLVAPTGPVTAQVRGTLPVNPLDGVTETVDVFPVVAPAARLRVVGLALSAKLGRAVTVTVTMLEVEVGYVSLSRNVAVTELAPDWSADPGTDSMQAPALNVQLPSEVVPALKLAVPVSAGGVSTYPVGVPPVTVAVNSVDSLEVMEAGEARSPVVLVNAVFHMVSRLLTFTVPMPATWSNPGWEG